MTKEILLEQFTACYDENMWFVALKNALKGDGGAGRLETGWRR